MFVFRKGGYRKRDSGSGANKNTSYAARATGVGCSAGVLHAHSRSSGLGWPSLALRRPTKILLPLLAPCGKLEARRRLTGIRLVSCRTSIEIRNLRTETAGAAEEQRRKRRLAMAYPRSISSDAVCRPNWNRVVFSPGSANSVKRKLLCTVLKCFSSDCPRMRSGDYSPPLVLRRTSGRGGQHIKPEGL